MTSIDRRLDQVAKTLQARQQALAGDDQTPTEDEVVELIVYHIRDTGLDHDGLRWIAQPGFYLEQTCAILASGLNRWAEDLPGVVFLPLYQDEIDAALAAFDAGSFALSETNYMGYRWLNLSAKTGTPMLSWLKWDQDVADLSRVVHRAAYSVHRQTGAPMPETLDAFRAWLIEVRPLGLARDLDQGV